MSMNALAIRFMHSARDHISQAACGATGSGSLRYDQVAKFISVGLFNLPCGNLSQSCY
jgi:hypothetical protein